MRQHPAIAERIPRDPGMGMVARIVRHEHERWDGTGYPDGLAGEAIPVGARIIHAGNAYHSMTTNRPYRSALSRDVAISGADRECRLPVRPEGRGSPGRLPDGPPRQRDHGGLSELKGALRPLSLHLSDLEDLRAAVRARALDRRPPVLHRDLLRVLDLDLLAFLDAVAPQASGLSFREMSVAARGRPWPLTLGRT